MSLYKRNGKWYYDFLIEGRRFNKSTGKTDKREAAEVEREAMSRAASLPKVPVPTLAEAIERAYRERWQYRKDGEQTRSRLERINAFFGGCSLDQLDRARIDHVRDWLEKVGSTDATVNRYLAALKTLLNMAHKDWECIASVPNIKLRPERPEHRRALTEDELDRIGRHLDMETYRLMYFLADTGMRLSEALGLTDEDIRGGCAYLTDTKAGRPRIVPLTERALRCRSVGPDGKLFPFGKWRYARAFKLAVEKSGVDPKGVCLHALRHTCCTNLVTRGAGLAAAGAVLGHSTATMTSRYAHLDVAALRKTVGLLEVG